MRPAISSVTATNYACRDVSVPAQTLRFRAMRSVRQSPDTSISRVCYGKQKNVRTLNGRHMVDQPKRRVAMRKRKQGSNAEHDPFCVVTSTTQAIVERYQAALAQLEQTPLPPELKGNVERELAELLKREIDALCNGGGG